MGAAAVYDEELERSTREGKQYLEKRIPSRGRDDEDKFGYFLILSRDGYLLNKYFTGNGDVGP